MDANEDIRTRETKKLFDKVGTKEVIINNNKQSPAATQDKNTKRELIDWLWAMRSLEIISIRYKPFGERCLLDYRVLWADFIAKSFLGLLIQEQKRERHGNCTIEIQDSSMNTTGKWHNVKGE